MSQLRREIDQRSSDGLLSSVIAFSETQEMPYLQACIKEGLRMHPATGLPLARVVPKGGVTIADRYIEEGVSSCISAQIFTSSCSSSVGRCWYQ